MKTPAIGPVARLRQLGQPFRSGDLRRLVAGFFLVELGDGIVAIVLPLGVYAATSSPLLTGISFAVSRGVGIFARPIGGVVADRFERIGILRYTILARVVAVLVAMATVGDNPTIGLMAVLASALVGTFDNPAAEAAIRVLARDAIQEVATIRRMAISISFLVGPAIGGVAISFGDLGAALVIAAVVFSVGLLVVTGLRSPPAGVPTLVVGGAVRQTFEEARQGFAHIRSRPDLRVVAAASVVNGFLVSVLVTVAVFYLDRLPSRPDGAFGLTVAGYSSGAVVGLLIAGTVAWTVSLRTVLWRSMIAYGAICIASVWVPRWYLLAIGWLLWGVVFGPEEVLSDVATVSQTPDVLLGRTYAGLGVLEVAGDATGSIVGGLLGEIVDARSVIVAVGFLYLIPIAAGFAFAARRSPVPGSD